MKSAMRRAGANPTDVEITDIINKAGSDTGCLDFAVRFCPVIVIITSYILYIRSFVRSCMREIRLILAQKEDFQKISL